MNPLYIVYTVIPICLTIIISILLLRNKKCPTLPSPSPSPSPSLTPSPSPTLPTAGEYIDHVQNKCMACCTGGPTPEGDPSYCDQYIKYRITECERNGSGCSRTTSCFRDCFQERQKNISEPLDKDTLDFCRQQC